MLAAVVVVILVLSLLLLIALFGTLPQFQGSVIARARVQLCRIPALAHGLDRKYTGGRVCALYRWVLRRGYGPSKWVVPGGYMALVLACFYYFHRDVYPQVSGWWTRHVFIPATYSLPVVLTPLAVFSDPGRITHRNQAQCMRQFPYDHVLFMSGAECRTCKRGKPARSKHCGVCGHCVQVCDHHCIWLNNCVGYQNARWFLLFVLQNAVVMAYGFGLTHAMVRRRALELQFQHLRWFLQRYTAAVLSSPHHGTAGCLMILCFTMGLVSVAFFVEQMRYVYLGVTTNETLKWENVADCMQDGDLYFYDHPSVQLRRASHARNEPSIVLQQVDDGFNRQLTADELQRIEAHQLALKPLTSFDQINNIYDRGFWDTLHQRFFPEPFY